MMRTPGSAGKSVAHRVPDGSKLARSLAARAAATPATPKELQDLRRLRCEIAHNLCSLTHSINTLSEDLDTLAYECTAGESVRANVTSLHAAQKAIRSTINILDDAACVTDEFQSDD
jgi:hypothetical protein